MRKILLILLISVVSIAEADARRRHHDKHRFIERDSPPEAERYSAGSRAGRSSSAEADDAIARLIPRNWQLEPPDPNWKGRRYVSPDGSAWVALYTNQTGQESVSAHMQAVAFVEGEQITYLRGERDRIAVSGLKDGRVFYRKAALACGGQSWHHVAFEYPVDAKRKMDGLVTRLSRRLDKYGSENCQQTVSSR